METVKKNILSIICGVVVIAAIAASFWPLGGNNEELQAEVDKSASTFRSLESLRTKARVLPSINPDNPQTEELNSFPGHSMIKWGGKVKDKVQAQSLAMRDEAVKMNAHEPLVKGSLPSPPSAKQIDFRVAYTRLFQVGPRGEPSQIANQLNAGMPPTPTEIQAAQLEEERQIRAKETIRIGGQENGQVMNEPEVQQKVAQRKAQLPQEMRENVAETKKLYLNPNTFDLNTNITGNRPPDPVNIWWAQVSLWIQQDVIQAINAANASAKNVKEAPVKHWIKIALPTPPSFVTAASAGPAAGVDPNAQMAVSDTSQADSELPRNVSVSFTGRVSNPLFDVVHFSMEFNVAADYAANFLRDLERNKLITVLECDQRSVDPAEVVTGGYNYGDTPVVNLNLKCEALLLRKWTQPLMPTLIKRQLGITDQPPTETATAQ